MPYPNEHACRLRQPGAFLRNTFARMSRKSAEFHKVYSVILAKLIKDGIRGPLTEQAYRYKKLVWAVSQARSHCKSHKGISFEPASESKYFVESRMKESVDGCCGGEERCMQEPDFYFARPSITELAGSLIFIDEFLEGEYEALHNGIVAIRNRLDEDLLLGNFPNPILEEMKEAASVGRLEPGQASFIASASCLSRVGGKNTFSGVEGALKYFVDTFPNTRILAEKMIMGVGCLLIKSHDSVRIISSQGRDLTSKLPSLVQAVLALPDKYVTLHGILEKWEETQTGLRPASKLELMNYLFFAQDVGDKTIVCNVVDVVFAMEDVHNLPLTARKTLLRSILITSSACQELKYSEKAIPTLTKKLVLLPYTIEMCAGSISHAVELNGILPGSLGVILKCASSTYPLSGVCSAWAELPRGETCNCVIWQKDVVPGGLFQYHLGLGCTEEESYEALNVVSLQKEDVVNIGLSSPVSFSFGEGEVVRVSFEKMNVFACEGIYRIILSNAKILSQFDGDIVSTVAEVREQVREKNLLIESDFTQRHLEHLLRESERR